MLRQSTTVILLSLLIFGAGALGGMAQPKVEEQKEKSVEKTDVRAKPQTADGRALGQEEITTLAEGFNAKVLEPFIAVARDAKTYGELRKLIESLPEKDEDFFKEHAVVAAFLGTKPSGGYSIAFMRGADESLRVAEVKPPADALSTMALTNLYKAVAVPSYPHEPVRLEPDEVWKKAARPYSLLAGSRFGMSGGFAGREHSFPLEGGILLLRHKNLVTLIFDLKSSGTTQERVLQDAATGVRKDNEVRFEYLTAGTLVEMPHPALEATGTLMEKDSHLTIAFKSLPTLVKDGYAGVGTLEAIIAWR